MSRTYKDNAARHASVLFSEWLKDDTSLGFEEKHGWEVMSALCRKRHFSPNSRKIAAYMKVQKRRRARRGLEREVLDARSYDVCWSEAQYLYECRYIYDTVYDYEGLHYLSFEKCGFILWPDDILPEDIIHENEEVICDCSPIDWWRADVLPSSDYLQGSWVKKRLIHRKYSTVSIVVGISEDLPGGLDLQTMTEYTRQP